MNHILMIDNAACASQNKTLIDDPITREAIQLNCIDPLERRIKELEDELDMTLTTHVKLNDEYHKLLAENERLKSTADQLITGLGNRLFKEDT